MPELLAELLQLGIGVDSGHNGLIGKQRTIMENRSHSEIRAGTLEVGLFTFDQFSALDVTYRVCFSAQAHEGIYKRFETAPHWKTTFTKNGGRGG